VNRLIGAASALFACSSTLLAQQGVRETELGSERAVTRHLQNGEESKLPLSELVELGKRLFLANWTDQDGAGRPLTTGIGENLVDTSKPLIGARGMNRISGPDANSCAGCHNSPRGVPGGAGDFASIVFQMAQRFDFVTFDRSDLVRRRGSLDEAGRPATLQTVGNARATPDLFGAGYLEMLARQITADLQRTRDSVLPGQSKPLSSTGIVFGTLSRSSDGAWITRRVEGLPPQSLVTRGSQKPTLVVRPWQASGTAVSLRELTNTALNQHFGVQSSERFGVGTDPDGDGIENEVTRGDVTALTVFVATLPVPGRVTPMRPEERHAIADGEQTFSRIGCATCHIPSLRLKLAGGGYIEPGPYNSSGNLRGAARTRPLTIDLADPALPQPRLTVSAGRDVVAVPAFTDFKLHDITDPNDREAAEPLDINQPPSSPRFLHGNRRFLTRRLWSTGSAPTHFHHGLFITIREAVLAHSGEALQERRAFEGLNEREQASLIAFLESMQVVTPPN